MSFHLILNPHGRLLLDVGAGKLPALESAFGQSAASGLLALSAHRLEPSACTAEVVFWREFADLFLTTLAHAPELVGATGKPVTADVTPPPQLGFDLALRIPAMPGAEYVTPELFFSLWRDLTALAQAEAERSGGLKPWLARINPALNLLGKVTFHLAENKRSPEAPFAFMATYTHRLTARDKPVHLPLARALQEYAGAKNQAALRSLLEPVRKAADQSPWARELLETRRLFQPQAWTPGQAYAFLREIPALEASGITVRIPDWWKNGRGPRPQIRVRIGGNNSAGLDVASLLKFTVESSLGDEPLSPKEWQALLASAVTSKAGQSQRKTLCDRNVKATHPCRGCRSVPSHRRL